MINFPVKNKRTLTFGANQLLEMLSAAGVLKLEREDEDDEFEEAPEIRVMLKFKPEDVLTVGGATILNVELPAADGLNIELPARDETLKGRI